MIKKCLVWWDDQVVFEMPESWEKVSKSCCSIWKTTATGMLWPREKIQQMVLTSPLPPFPISPSLYSLAGRHNTATSPFSTLNFSLTLAHASHSLSNSLLPCLSRPPSRAGCVSRWERKYCGEQIKWWTAAKIILRVPRCYCLTGEGKMQRYFLLVCVY